MRCRRRSRAGDRSFVREWRIGTALRSAPDEFPIPNLFEKGAGQKICLWLKVPQGYISGRQIFIYIGQYSPSTSNTQLLTATSYLIRKNTDAVTSTTNANTSTNTALTNSVANQYREVALDITDNLGRINSIAVSPGDLIRVEIARGSDTDVDDIRMIPSSTEVKLS